MTVREHRTAESGAFLKHAENRRQKPGRGGRSRPIWNWPRGAWPGVLLFWQSLLGRRAEDLPGPGLPLVRLELVFGGERVLLGFLLAVDLVAGQVQVLVFDRERLAVVHLLGRGAEQRRRGDADVVRTAELVVEGHAGTDPRASGLIAPVVIHIVAVVERPPADRLRGGDHHVLRGGELPGHVGAELVGDEHGPRRRRARRVVERVVLVLVLDRELLPTARLGRRRAEHHRLADRRRLGLARELIVQRDRLRGLRRLRADDVAAEVLLIHLLAKCDAGAEEPDNDGRDQAGQCESRDSTSFSLHDDSSLWLCADGTHRAGDACSVNGKDDHTDYRLEIEGPRFTPPPSASFKICATNR